jgi:putative ABC transport system ATP-binding protein
MGGTNAVIEFAGVNLSFSGKNVIDDLSLIINSGDKVVVSGKSGCGKSSLLSLVLGFVEPDSGSVLFGGVAVDGKTVWSVRRKVALIDQDVSLGSGSVENLFEFVSGLKVNAHLDFSLHKFMEFFHLQGILHKNLKDLSGGERQRLAIVVSVLLGRKVFFLDEVTSSLDANLKKKVADYFLEKQEWTCLIVSHDPVWLESSVVRVFSFEEKVWKQ